MSIVHVKFLPRKWRLSISIVIDLVFPVLFLGFILIIRFLACMVDGFLFYKFQIKLDKHGQIVYKVAEILNKNCASPNLNVEKDEELTFEELIEKIKDTTI